MPCTCDNPDCPYPNFTEEDVWDMEGQDRTKHLMLLVKAGMYAEALIIEQVIVEAKKQQAEKRAGATEPKRMKYDRLVVELEKRELSTDGLKLVLVERLETAIAEEKKAADLEKKKAIRAQRKQADAERSAERRKKVLAQREQRKQLAAAVKTGGLAKLMAIKAQMQKTEQEIAEVEVKVDIPVTDPESRIAASTLKGTELEEFTALCHRECEEFHEKIRREKFEAKESAAHCAYVSYKGISMARKAIKKAEELIVSEQTFFHIEWDKIQVHVTNVQLVNRARVFIMIGYGSGQEAVDVRTEISELTDRPVFTRSLFSITLHGKISRFLSPKITLGILERMKKQFGKSNVSGKAPDDSLVFALFSTERIKSARGKFKFRPRMLGTAVLGLEEAVESLKQGYYFFKEVVFHDPMSANPKKRRKEYTPKEVGRAFILLNIRHLDPAQNELGEIIPQSLGNPKRRDSLWKDPEVMEDGLRENLGWFKSCRRYADSSNLLSSLQAHDDTPVYDMQVMPTKRPLTGEASKGTFEIITAGGDHILKRWNMDHKQLLQTYKIQGFDEKHNKQEKTEWEDQNLINAITSFIEPIAGHTAPVLTCAIQLLPQEKRLRLKQHRAEQRERHRINKINKKRQQAEAKAFALKEKKRAFEARKRREKEYEAFMKAAKDRANKDKIRPKTTIGGEKAEDADGEGRPFTTGSPKKSPNYIPKGWKDSFIPILSEFLSNPMLVSMKNISILKFGMPKGIKPRGYSSELAAEFVDKFIPRVRKRMKGARMPTGLIEVQKFMYALRRGATLSAGEILDLREIKKDLDHKDKVERDLKEAEKEFQRKADSEKKEEDLEAIARRMEREKNIQKLVGGLAKTTKTRRKKKKRRRRKKKTNNKNDTNTDTGGGTSTDFTTDAGETTEGAESEKESIIKKEMQDKNETKNSEINKVLIGIKSSSIRPKSALKKPGSSMSSRPRSVRFKEPDKILTEATRRGFISDPGLSGMQSDDTNDLLSDPDERRTLSDAEFDSSKRDSPSRGKHRPGTAPIPKLTHSLVPGLPVSYVKRVKTSYKSNAEHVPFVKEEDWWPASDENSEDLDDLCRIVSGSGDRSTKIWGTTSGKVKSTLLEHTGVITFCTCSSDGKFIATTSEDGKICLWDGTKEENQLMHTYSGHNDTVSSCAFSPDDKYLLSGGGYLDPSLKLWDVRSAIGNRALRPVSRQGKEFEAQEEVREVKRMERIQAMMAPVNNLYWQYQLRLESEYPGRRICQAVEPVPPWWDNGDAKPEWLSLSSSTKMGEYAKTYKANKAHAHGLERFAPPEMPLPVQDPTTDPQFDPYLKEKLEKLEKEKKARIIREKKEAEEKEALEQENLRLYGNRQGDPDASSEGSGTTYYSYSEEEITPEMEAEIFAKWDEEERQEKIARKLARKKEREKYMWWITPEPEPEEEPPKRYKDYTPSELRKMTKEEVDKIRAEEMEEINKVQRDMEKRKRKARRKLEKMLEQHNNLGILPKEEKYTSRLSRALRSRLNKNADAMFMTTTSGESDTEQPIVIKPKHKLKYTSGASAPASAPPISLPITPQNKLAASSPDVNSIAKNNISTDKTTSEATQDETKDTKDDDASNAANAVTEVDSDVEDNIYSNKPSYMQPGVPVVAPPGGYSLTWCGCVALENGYCSLVEHQLQGRADQAAKERATYVTNIILRDLEEGRDTEERKDVDEKIDLLKRAWDAREAVKHRKYPEHREPFNHDAAEELIIERRLERAQRNARVQARDEVMGMRNYDIPDHDPYDPRYIGLLRVFEERVEGFLTARHTNSINSVTFSNNGIYCASASEDKTVKLWDPSTGLLIRSLLGHEGPVQYCEFAADSRALVTSGSDTSIRIWDCLAGEQIQLVRGHRDVIFRSRFMPDTRSVVSCSFDGSVKLWRVSPEPPESPPNVHFSDVITDEIARRSECKLHWDKPQENGSKIINYHVLRRKVKKASATTELMSNKGGLFTDITSIRGHSSTVATKLHIDYLRPGSTYQFSVAAETVIGIGKYSIPVTHRMPSAVPDTIKQPKDMSNSMTSITIRWVQPDCNGANIRLYEVTYKGGGIENFCEKVYAIVPKKSRKLAEEYEKKFGASGKIGELRRQAQEQFRNLKKGGNMSKQKLRKAKARLKKRVQRAMINAQEEAKRQGVDLSEISHMFEVWGLKSGYEYNFQVRARNHVGWGAWCPMSFSAQTQADTPEKPEPPALMKSSAVHGIGLIKVNWSIPFHRGAMITQYVVRCVETREEHEIDADIYDTTFGTRALPQGVDEEGNGQIENESEEEDGTQNIGSPKKRSTKKTNIKKNTMNAFMSKGNLNLLKLVKKKSKGDAPMMMAERIAEKKLRIRETGPNILFIPGKFYTFTIRAKNLIGWSETSIISESIRAPCLAPEKPDRPMARDPMPRSLKLRWMEAKGNGSRPTHYEIQMCIAQTDVFNSINPTKEPTKKKGKKNTDDDEEENFRILGSTVTLESFKDIFEVKINGLEASQVYEFQVRAFNEVGASKWSDVSIPINTQDFMEPMPPDPPVLNSTFTKPTSCAVKWSKPEDDGGTGIKGYELFIHRGRNIDTDPLPVNIKSNINTPEKSNGKSVSSDSNSDSESDTWVNALKRGDDWEWESCLKTNAHGRGGQIENLSPHIEYHFSVIAYNKVGRSKLSAPSDTIILPNSMEHILQKAPTPVREEDGT